MEQEIVETIGLNDVVILCGETGSGKSTQVREKYNILTSSMEYTVIII
jgi:HrpA-like RNA helicase